MRLLVAPCTAVRPGLRGRRRAVTNIAYNVMHPLLSAHSMNVMCTFYESNVHIR